MKEKDIIKTIFSFFIIDLIIFAILAYIIAIFIGLLISIPFPDAGIKIISLFHIVILLVLMYWNYKYRYQGKFQEEDAIKVIELRYATGETTKEEFEQMKKDIES
ncbi:MAG: hypothetical protein KAW45_01100 [Thermoplasmatales archaeon]|nr:hypothetical protein [Thermoplasmatales archaeon]